MIHPIISVDELTDFPDAVFADVRWYLDGRNAHDEFTGGHLPGAVFVDLETSLAAHDLPASEGRHPFPTPQAFAAAMSSLGISDHSTVIAYDDTGGMTAGRLVVMLRMIGRNAAVLDGGIGAWNGPLVTGDEPAPTPTTFTETPWPAERFATAAETAELAASDRGVVIDARSHERFTGEITAIDPRPGHVPGAVSAPFGAVLDPVTKCFRPAHELRQHFSALGVADAADVVTYCGSGVSTCVNILAIEHVGLAAARIYVASFSGWSSDATRTVETGPGR